MNMSEDGISKRLQELEHIRVGLHDQISETVSVLGAVEQKIQDLKARQQARIRSDDRIDNKIADQIAQGSSHLINAKNSGPIARSPLKAASSSEEKHVQLVPDGLTEADITVHPIDKDNE
jgi:hypothetical protein